MIRASAPAKIILFGEHAVVYGETAIATAVNKRAVVTVAELEEPKIIVESKDMGTRIESRFDEQATDPIVQAAQAALKYANKETGLGIEIISNIPVAIGMGSSAAVSTATAAAVLTLVTGTTPTLEVAEIAYEGEKIAHGKPSGIDTAITTFGKTISFKKGAIENIEGTELSLVVGNTGIQRKTRDLVMGLKAKIEDPRMATSLFSIGSIVKKANKALQAKNAEELGRLMDQNHELLRKLGLSCPELEKLCTAARKAGAYGAKLTGAGGGGCMIALCENPKEILPVMQAAGAVSAFEVRTNQEGVRVEGTGGEV